MERSSRRIFYGTYVVQSEESYEVFNFIQFSTKEHKIHEKIRPWIRFEVTELLKKEKANDTEMVVKSLWRTLLVLVKILQGLDDVQ
ncbi:hypothetical protein MKW98_001709 [Papaver atlanticum]|uniref:Uncharacterized protein n=1 Tax=Papaver atlanticum TaxID=357466 RepID=A0AAD4S6X7_9MAGN|nr:hypothetical protein MKW98_001709 [Papaver atlanticum]